MKLVVGLGNPGKEYTGTRHNAGFEVIDKLAYDNNIDVSKGKFKAVIGEGIIKGKKVVLIKPVTFMNLSGHSVREAMNWYKTTEEDIIVIYDDISLPVGEIRVRQKGSAGGHNGMKSIIEQLGTENFIRVRVGVGEKPQGWDLADYVLGKFSKDEIPTIIEGFTKASEATEIILNTGVSTAMNKFNKKNG